MNSASSPYRFARILAVAALCLGLVAVVLVAQDKTGVIRGTVVDKRTGEGVPAVNIVVKGTYYGASSDIDGKFRITGVGSGSYVVEASIIGYKLVRFGAVKVTAGAETVLKVEVEETALSLGEEVVVIGQKPLFDIGETSSRRSVNTDDIRQAGVVDAKDIVAQQTGVVKSDDQIYIRGSRSYENAYIVDGVSVQDPLAGTGFGISLPPGAIQEVEVITGGYNAEFGQATSGVVNFTTREGGETYAGSVTHKRDHFGFNDQERNNFNTDILEAYLSGPEPVTSRILPALGIQVPGAVSFFGTFNMNLQDGYTRWVEKIGQNGMPVGWELKTPGGLTSSIYGGSRFAPRRSNAYAALGKVTWRLSGTERLTYTATQSVSINQNTQTVQTTLERQEPLPGYQYAFQQIPDSAATFTQVNTQQSLLWSQTINTRTFYEIRFSFYTAHVRGDANGRSWEYYREPKDIVNFPVVYYNTGHDTVGVIPGDGFYDVGSPTSWRDHFVQEATIKFDLTSNFTEFNKFKGGVEFKSQRLQMVDIASPWYRPLGYDNDIYSVKPFFFATYGQESITFGGMILNFGLRLDGWVPGKYVDQAVDDPNSLVSPTIRQAYKDHTTKILGYRWKGRLSPRLAIAHPVSDNQTLFFSYGHFSKFPRPQFVYSKLIRSNARSTFQTIGNPDLNPETTVAYELGLRNQLSENDVLTVTAYYKDIFDYITSRSIRAQATRFSAGSYQTYVNLDYARSRGLEVEYKTRISDWFRGGLSLSYSLATGKSSQANEALFNIQRGEEEKIVEQPLVWDRPLQGSLTLNFRVPQGQPLIDGWEGVLDGWSVYSRWFAQSGRRYTPVMFTGTDPLSGRPIYISDSKNPYSKIGSAIINADLNLEKTIRVAGTDVILTLEISNILDRRNVQIINPATGTGYEFTTDGQPTPTVSTWNDPHYPDLQGPVDPFPYNPARYAAPRNYRLGASVRF